MKLGKLRRRSGEGGVIDRRAAGPTGGSGTFPGLGRIPIGRGGMGVGGLVMVLLLVFVLPRILGQAGLEDLGGSLDPFSDTGVVAPGSETKVDPQDPTAKFAEAVLEDVQFAWADVFDRAGLTYLDTAIVLFRGSTTSGCGPASSATGPFYCPADRRVYLDLGFFKELE